MVFYRYRKSHGQNLGIVLISFQKNTPNLYKVQIVYVFKVFNSKTEPNLKYWTARAKRDNDKVHQSILDGEIKTIQEIKNALGVVSPSIRCYISKDTSKAAKVLLDKFGEDWVKNLIKELENLM